MVVSNARLFPVDLVDKTKAVCNDAYESSLMDDAVTQDSVSESQECDDRHKSIILQAISRPSTRGEMVAAMRRYSFGSNLYALGEEIQKLLVKKIEAEYRRLI